MKKGVDDDGAGGGGDTGRRASVGSHTKGTRATPSGAEHLSAGGLKAGMLNRQEEGGWKAAEI